MSFEVNLPSERNDRIQRIITALDSLGEDVMSIEIPDEEGPFRISRYDSLTITISPRPKAKDC